MKILLTEDDENIQVIAKLALTKVGGHEVLCVSSGEELLSKVQDVRPDLILLDIMMPGLDGFETFSILKKNENPAPVIFLTARAQLSEIQKGMSLGAQGYILKPFDPMTLSQRIQEILGALHAA